MPSFSRGEIRIAYEVYGSGYPVLLLAPGGMRSGMSFWQRTPFNPILELREHFRLIAMDQRNAGASRAPVHATDGWHTYVEDQLALLDELGIERCHLFGGCIGGAFSLALIDRAPARVSAAVLQQPIGRSHSNRETFHVLFQGWAEELLRERPELTAEALASLEENMYDRDFAFSVTREQVARCAIPLLVLRGDDEYHPAGVSEEIARVAPRAELIRTWKTGEDVAHAVARVRAFLLEHTPR